MVYIFWRLIQLCIESKVDGSACITLCILQMISDASLFPLALVYSLHSLQCIAFTRIDHFSIEIHKIQKLARNIFDFLLGVCDFVISEKLKKKHF